MKIGILGGGLAGLAIALFLQDADEITEIDIFEKESEAGGLCRSFSYDGRDIDIGPHIFFSKDKETLQWMLELLGDNSKQLKRSSQIIYKGRFVQYPFENDLSKLPDEDRKRCVHSFLNNPYRGYPADNMLQFFLKTFGEGITNIYLRPYNEKIWKFDPSFMNTQMVDRIPCPPDEDIIRSANGETVDGYLHQLYFYYPIQGGMKAFIKAIIERFTKKVSIYTNSPVKSLVKKGKEYEITAANNVKKYDRIISCMPLNKLTDLYHNRPERVAECGRGLKYNNILLALATLSWDGAGNNNGFLVADKDVIFHRLSKVDYYGNNYHKEKTVTYLMEYTYRDGDIIAEQDENELKRLFSDGLKKIGFLHEDKEMLMFESRKFPYAYIIYDLNHNENTSYLRNFFQNEGIYLNGRFGNFEYWNMDKVIVESKKLAEIILGTIDKK